MHFRVNKFSRALILIIFLDMNRIYKISKYFNRADFGLEIAPNYNPIASKLDGWNCLSLDIFCAEDLRNLTLGDEISIYEKRNRIEEVDIVASANDLDKILISKNLIGSFDYICSSHNFEHLPNPIKFLRDCGLALKLGAYLSMAIPDKRHTFDCARTLTSTKDFLRPFLNHSAIPDFFDVFDSESSYIQSDENSIRYFGNLSDSYERLKFRLGSSEYIDTHVTTFTPKSFLHIITELSILELIPLELIEVEPLGSEFIVHFKNVGFNSIYSDKDKFIQIRDGSLGACFRN